MSTLEKRLHLMIDQARYERLVQEAERTGRSVADVVRTSIDEHFDETSARARRAAAARFLLASAARPGTEASESWEEMLATQDADLDESLRVE